MSALPTWATLRRQIIDGARYHPEQEAHLDPSELPEFALEAGHADLLISLCQALGEVEGKRREKICTLWADYCKSGDDMSIGKVSDLLSAMRAAHLDDALREAQKMVDQELL